MSLAVVLFVVFLVLKLTHAIDWSWWWVSAPLWLSAALTVAVWVGVSLATYAGDGHA